jgi:hypothetical protein
LTYWFEGCGPWLYMYRNQHIYMFQAGKNSTKSCAMRSMRGITVYVIVRDLNRPCSNRSDKDTAQTPLDITAVLAQSTWRYIHKHSDTMVHPNIRMTGIPPRTFSGVPQPTSANPIYLLPNDAVSLFESSCQKNVSPTLFLRRTHWCVIYCQLRRYDWWSLWSFDVDPADTICGQDNRSFQAASVELYNQLIDQLNQLNRQLTYDQQNRQTELRGVHARIDRLRDDFIHLFQGK